MEERLLLRPMGPVARVIVVALLVTAPTILFFHADQMPFPAHVTRPPLEIYTLFSDDVAYVAGSRTWARTMENLFQPHNVHIIPAWRLLTYALVLCAGDLEHLPDVLAIASYSILIAVMLIIRRLVTRESDNPALGLAAMVLVGTTSLMVAPVMWYSAGQPLWSGFVILATVWYAQDFRRTGRMLALLLATVCRPDCGLALVGRAPGRPGGGCLSLGRSS